MNETKPKKETGIVSKLIYYLAVLFFTLFIINEAHFIYHKQEIPAEVLEKTKVNKNYKLHLRFKYKGQRIEDYFPVKCSVAEDIEGASTGIYYDDFLFEDLYFKVRHPYFVLQFIFYLLVYLSIISPLYFPVILWMKRKYYRRNL